VAAGHEIPLVLTQPDRAAGRGLSLAASPVKRFAAARGLRVLQPASLKDTQIAEVVDAVRADALVVAAYGLLLPPALLKAARYGALNIHASLLPRWRGAAPIQRALLAGDRETGISIMQMDAGLDTGPVLKQERIAIAADEDAGTLHASLAALGARLIVSTLAEIESGGARSTPQPAAGVTYAPKIDKRETRLDWSRPARELERAVRAFRPAPGAFTLRHGEPLKVWRARVANAAGAPGTLREAGDELLVACGEEGLAIAELQRAGGRRQAALEYLRGHPLRPGERFA
jgi:methionyl-tRNA formyltransferase